MALGPPFTFVRFSVRWAFTTFILMATYNPSGYSYSHWITSDDGSYLSVKFAVGLYLAWWYLALIPILWTSLGPIGIGMMVALLSAFGLVCWDYGLLDHVTPSLYPYSVIVSAGLILALALSWGHINLQVWHLKLVRKIAPKQL